MTDGESQKGAILPPRQIWRRRSPLPQRERERAEGGRGARDSSLITDQRVQRNDGGGRAPEQMASGPRFPCIWIFPYEVARLKPNYRF
jgi:hypothetical protein